MWHYSDRLHWRSYYRRIVMNDFSFRSKQRKSLVLFCNYSFARQASSNITGSSDDQNKRRQRGLSMFSATIDSYPVRRGTSLFYQDEIPGNLQYVASVGSGEQHQHAAKVLRVHYSLLHCLWVLLLLGDLMMMRILFLISNFFIHRRRSWKLWWRIWRERTMVIRILCGPEIRQLRSVNEKLIDETND